MIASLDICLHTLRIYGKSFDIVERYGFRNTQVAPYIIYNFTDGWDLIFMALKFFFTKVGQKENGRFDCKNIGFIVCACIVYKNLGGPLFCFVVSN